LIRNEEKVLDAVVAIVSTGGWAAATHASVSRAAGLSTRPVHDRFADRSALAVATWRERTGPALHSALAEVLASCGLLDSDPSVAAPMARPAGLIPQMSPLTAHWQALRVTAEAGFGRSELARTRIRTKEGQSVHRTAVHEAELALASRIEALHAAIEATEKASVAVDFEELRAAGPSAAWFTIALTSFARPGPMLRAATELLVISEFDDGLATQIRAQTTALLLQWCSPSDDDISPSRAAQRAYVLAVALGLLAAHHRTGSDTLRLDDEAATLFGALLLEHQPIDLPAGQATHLATQTPIETGDPALDSLLSATLAEVAARGFDGTTVDSIARAAGCSDGLVFGRYESKLALFLDATRRQQAIAWRANEDYQAKIAALHGHSIADAVAIRELQRPEVRTQRALYLEQVRLSWHDNTLRDAQAAEYERFIDEARDTDLGGLPLDNPAALHMSIAVGFGLALLPILLPEAWDLPYDVVTVPLAEVTKGVDMTFAPSDQTIGARSRSGSRSLIVDRTSASDATKF
jgi:AcrR family transcriptional regulator